MSKEFCFKHIINNKKESSLLVDLLQNKISKRNFKNTTLFKNIEKFVLLNSFKDYERYFQHAKEFLEVLNIENEESLNFFLKKNNWIKSNVKDILFNYIKSILHSDFSLCKEDRIYNPNINLVKLFIDYNFIKQVEKDKIFIVNLKNEIKQVQIYLKNKNNKSLEKFVQIRVGWFDEPFDNGDKNQLYDLLDKSLKQCDIWIKNEISGKMLHCETSFDIKNSSGQSDSWDEWKYIFPNTLKWFEHQAEWQKS